MSSKKKIVSRYNITVNRLIENNCMKNENVSYQLTQLLPELIN